MITGHEKTKEGSGEKEYEIIVDNGDLQLIDSLVTAYNFKDRDAMIKFGIAALLEGTNNEGLYTIKLDSEGKRILSKITPPTELLK